MPRKSLPRSLISRAEDAAADTPEAREADRPALAGAWRAGATAQLRADLEASEAETLARVLDGRAELSLSPDAIDDPLGSDRRPDWREREDFVALRESIAANGQDVPVQVTPLDPDWTPNPRDPFDTAGARFALLAGRRRLAALQELGRTVRAVIVPPGGDGQGGDAARDPAARRAWMLTRRWRENAERADLSPFERLLAIGEMFDAAKAADPGETAARFGERVGVSESVVSRARAVSARREAILAAVPDPYALSNTALYKLLPRLDAPPAPKARPALSARRMAGAVALKATVKDGTLTLTAKGLTDGYDGEALDALLADVAKRLKKEGGTGG